jgi:hypothetical protein
VKQAEICEPTAWGYVRMWDLPARWDVLRHHVNRLTKDASSWSWVVIKWRGIKIPSDSLFAFQLIN